MGRRSWAGALLLLLLAGTPRWGIAKPADDACFTAYEQTQRLRREGKLLEAEGQAETCAREVCPSLLRTDCTRWAGEIAHDVPTIVFAAKDERGQDLADVSVAIDGHTVVDSLDGRPVSVDPGSHHIRFASKDRTSDLNVVVATGETNRLLEATLAPPAAPAAPAPGPPWYRRRVPVVSIVLGGVAAVGLVSFVSFAVAGRVEQGCAPTCSSGQVSTLRAEYAFADASWITGLAALGGAFAFWIAQPAPAGAPGAATDRHSALRLEASPTRGGATLGLMGSF